MQVTYLQDKTSFYMNRAKEYEEEEIQAENELVEEEEECTDDESVPPLDVDAPFGPPTEAATTLGGDNTREQLRRCYEYISMN